MTTQIKAAAGGYDLPMYNRQGVRISLDEWAILFSEGRSAADPTAGYHRVGYDMVGPFAISTVWRGLDARDYLGGDGPLIFETCVMSPSGDQILRHTTEAEAEHAHAGCVAAARSAATIAGAMLRLFEEDGES